MKKVFGLVVVGLLVLSLTGVANAVSILKLESDGITKTIYDDGAGDLSSETGSILFHDSVGNFYLNMTGGVTKPVIGTADDPFMDIVSLNASSTAGGTLDIWFTETGFTGLEPMDFYTSIGGTTDGTVSFETFVDFGNNEFATTTKLSELTGLVGGPGGAFAGSESSNVNFNVSPYSLTLHVTVEHTGVAATSFDAELSPIPEPATMLLLGLGLVGLAGVSRKKNRK